MRDVTCMVFRIYIFNGEYVRSEASLRRVDTTNLPSQNSRFVVVNGNEYTSMWASPMLKFDSFEVMNDVILDYASVNSKYSLQLQLICGNKQHVWQRLRL